MKKIKSATFILILFMFSWIPKSIGINSAPYLHIEVDHAGLEPHKLSQVCPQVYEGLFRYNYSTLPLTTIPQLARDFGSWNLNNTQVSIPLREDVVFHDGTPFNASAVHWNCQRLMDIITSKNRTDDFVAYGYWYYQQLLSCSNQSLILNKTEIIDTYTIKFYLNYPIAPDLWYEKLAHPIFYIIKPNPKFADNYIPIEEKGVGTGPFQVTTLVNGIHCVSNENYYLPPPAIKSIIFHTASHRLEEDLKNNYIYYAEHVSEASHWTEKYQKLQTFQINNTVLNLIQLNQIGIQRDIRKAMGWALNYSAITNIYGDPIISNQPWNQVFHHKNLNLELAETPSYNITHARKILLNSEDPSIQLRLAQNNLTSASTAQEWIQVATSTNPIGEYNFTYHHSPFRTLYGQFHQDFQKIGLKINEMYWSPWLHDSYKIPDNWVKHIMITTVGGDIYHPLEILNTLFSPNEVKNPLNHVNGAIQSLVLSGLQSSSITYRSQVITQILEYILTDCPFLLIGQTKTNPVWNTKYLSKLSDCFNPLGVLYFYNVDFHPPRSIIAGTGVEFVSIIIISLVLVVFKLKKDNKSYNLRIPFL